MVFEGSLVNFTFNLDTTHCSPRQTRYIITISRVVNGLHVDVCKFVLTDKCTASTSSVMCFCLSSLGSMLFTKRMSSNDNNTVYIWKWGDIHPDEKEKRVTIEIASMCVIKWVLNFVQKLEETLSLVCMNTLFKLARWHKCLFITSISKDHNNSLSDIYI